MNELLGIRSNIYYKKVKKGQKHEYERVHELIFLSHKPAYTVNNEGVVIRERAVDEFRVSVTMENMDILIKNLESLKNANEEDMTS